MHPSMVSIWNIPTREPKLNNLYGVTRWTHMRYFPPLHEMPHQWQPTLNKINSYHWSGAELLKSGWTKWNSAGHPDILADSSKAVQPDWHTRRIQNTYNEDKNYCEHWSYDRWDKPTSTVPLGLKRIVPAELQRMRPIRGSDRTTVRPRALSHGSNSIHYGIGSDYLYEDPIRARQFPPLGDPKHV
ncbi:hypothetical protein EG68_03133 [Paragonimus skrjabini miyazakii]|uniref:Uncharacterized protein n=1 Tax=Paragonimus skrjabini miyazakii TaxID=59628 RepID=A0A8S9Z2E8_9TREM|nr:hypothetical protein EG68_03133 [Paragonimus skrjabini miyazakii]